MKRSQPKRLWDDALEKVRSEGRCRSCGQGGVVGLFGLQIAHLLGRKYDSVVVGPRGGKYRYVDPDNVVALCWPCHLEFDAHRLSLIGKLTMAELRNTIKTVGKHRARRRLGGGRGA